MHPHGERFLLLRSSSCSAAENLHSAPISDQIDQIHVDGGMDSSAQKDHAHCIGNSDHLHVHAFRLLPSQTIEEYYAARSLTFWMNFGSKVHHFRGLFYGKVVLGKIYHF
jgi:hypothetical protein